MSDKPANRILAALLSEQGRVIDDGARHHVEATNRHEHHDLHRMADDGCPHHDDDPWGTGGSGEVCADPLYYEERHVYQVPAFAASYKPDSHLIPVSAVVRKSNRELAEDSEAAMAEFVRGFHLPTDAKARKSIPLCTGVLDYFPKALAAVAEVSRIGNDQHNPGQPLHWAKGKSTDHADCAVRHFAERGTRDTDGGRHTAKAAWRVLAHLEMEIEAEEAGMSYADYIAHLKAQEAA